jgi:hypothetical protein
MYFDQPPPVGYGTLGQRQVSLVFQTDAFEIQVMPLTEGIIRMLSPDTYNSFHRLLLRKAPEIEEAASRYGLRSPTLFLVTFFGRQNAARFIPELLQVTSQNRVFRPTAILPLSPLWNDQQLNQRETAIAIYMYSDGIRLETEMSVSYDRFTTNAWAGIIRTLEQEWVAIQARSSQDGQ